MFLRKHALKPTKLSLNPSNIIPMRSFLGVGPLNFDIWSPLAHGTWYIYVAWISWLDFELGTNVIINVNMNIRSVLRISEDLQSKKLLYISFWQKNFHSHTQFWIEFPSAHPVSSDPLSPSPTSGIVILGTTKDGVCTSSDDQQKGKPNVVWLDGFLGKLGPYMCVNCVFFQIRCDGIILHMICWSVGMDHQQSTCTYVEVQVQAEAGKMSKKDRHCPTMIIGGGAPVEHGQIKTCQISFIIRT